MLLETLRTADYDRYLAALFAPAAARPHLLALYAFNYEVAKTAESVSQPIAGQIRLQWWREAIDEIYAGKTRAHDVAQALAGTIGAHGLPRAPFDALIDAHEYDLDEAPFADLASLEAYCDATAGNLMRLASRVLGAGDTADDAARHAGIAYALTGLLRAVPFHARARRLMLPEAGLNRDDVFAGEADLAAVFGEIAARAKGHLAALGKGRVSRRFLPALLPAAVVPGYLGVLTRHGFNPFRDVAEAPLHRRQWAMLAAMLRGRI
jgi:phytoene synthase